MEKQKVHRLILVGVIATIAVLNLKGLDQNSDWKASVTTVDEDQLLEITLDVENIELDPGDPYSFTSYGVYSTVTVPIKTEWALSGDALGSLSCEGSSSKTCDFESNSSGGEADLTIELIDDGQTFQDIAYITVSAPVENPFSDEIPDWADKSIIRLKDMGIMKGYDDGQFGAGDSLTQGQVVTLVDRLLDYKAIDYNKSEENCDIYPDISSDHYAYKSICHFYYAGWLDEEAGDKWGVDDPATRAVTSQLMYNVVGETVESKMDIDMDLYASAIDFSDVTITNSNSTAIAAMDTFGIMNGYDDGTFGPNNTLNRAEAAVVIDRMRHLLENLDVSTLEPTALEDEKEETALLKSCDNEDHVKSYVEDALGENLSAFELRQFNTDVLLDQLETGTLTISVVDENGELVEREVPVESQTLRMDGVTTAIMKDTKGGNRYETETLPDEQGYLVGCNEGDGICGVVTILDEEATQIEASFMDVNAGYTFIEPADNLLATTGGSASQVTSAEGCHLFYNSEQHADVLEDAPSHEDDTMAKVLKSLSDSWGSLPSLAATAEAQDDILIEQIPIVLDAEANYRSINTRTVWSRQRSLLAGLNLLYGFVEPFGNGNFAITFPIEGQEAWLPGYGPTTGVWDDLVEEINDEDYYMLNHPSDNELSYYYVGYDMDGSTAGASYVGTFCSDDEDEDKNHAWGQQVVDTSNGYAFSTLYGRTIVMAHEIGHNLGGTHADAVANTCGQGWWEDVCGSTILRSGATGGADPDDRMPYFSPANSDSITECVDNEL